MSQPLNPYNAKKAYRRAHLSMSTRKVKTYKRLRFPVMQSF